MDRDQRLGVDRTVLTCHVWQPWPLPNHADDCSCCSLDVQMTRPDGCYVLVRSMPPETTGSWIWMAWWSAPPDADPTAFKPERYLPDVRRYGEIGSYPDRDEALRAAEAMLSAITRDVVTVTFETWKLC